MGLEAKLPLNYLWVQKTGPEVFGNWAVRARSLHELAASAQDAYMLHHLFLSTALNPHVVCGRSPAPQPSLGFGFLCFCSRDACGTGSEALSGTAVLLSQKICLVVVAAWLYYRRFLIVIVVSVVPCLSSMAGEPGKQNEATRKQQHAWVLPISQTPHCHRLLALCYTL